MGFWIFDRKKNAETSARMLDAALAERERMARPAVRVKHTATSGRSRIGGAPLLPAEFQWPQWKDRSLSHVAQLDLEELWAAVPDAPDWLPRAGLLTFFYDQEQSTWGFDPADKDSWRVCLIEGTNLREAALPDDMEKHARYVPVTVAFETVPSFPSWERLVRPEDLRRLTPADYEKWAKLTLSEEAPNHRIGGFPDPIQADQMELESQLASNGLYVGDGRGYKDPRAKALRDGAADWRLLLQLDTDDDARMMWGDVGRLYFWVREADARARDFSRTWMVLQCT